MNRFTQFAVAAFLLASIASIPAANAQWWANGGSSGSKPVNKRPPVAPLAKDAFNTTNLKTAPDLPGVPRWTGNQPVFLDGHFYPNLEPIEVYTCAWAYREPAGTVSSWYKEAFAAQGWQINPASTRDNCIVARHKTEPYEVQFQITPSARPGYRCTAEVRWTKNPKFAMKVPRR